MIVGNEQDAWRAAQALQRWTNDNMKFDAGIAIAPASEVARDRRGTCFGYSMLLGALTRAAGIPSRLRMGYVYAGGIWGGHAWIDVRIGDRWIPLDGALYSPGAADAARFSFFASALEEGTLVGAGSLAQLLGNADIKILEYTSEGNRVVVPDNAAPFSVESDVYRNPWLGISIRKPSDFKFKDVELAWPQTALVALEGPHGESFEVKNLSVSLPTSERSTLKDLHDEVGDGQTGEATIAGHKAAILSSERKAGAVLTDRGSVWAFIATGPNAAKLLQELAASVVLQ